MSIDFLNSIQITKNLDNIAYFLIFLKFYLDLKTVKIKVFRDFLGILWTVPIYFQNQVSVHENPSVKFGVDWALYF
jgi:hypothetical protein